jgi:hypothetical protein
MKTYYPEVDEIIMHAFWLGMGLYLVACYAILLKGVGFICFLLKVVVRYFETLTGERNIACYCSMVNYDRAPTE